VIFVNIVIYSWVYAKRPLAWRWQKRLSRHLLVYLDALPRYCLAIADTNSALCIGIQAPVTRTWRADVIEVSGCMLLMLARAVSVDRGVGVYKFTRLYMNS
jgi:hypothetical protein